MDAILTLLIVFWIVKSIGKSVSRQKKTGQKKVDSRRANGRTVQPSDASVGDQPVSPAAQGTQITFMMPPLEDQPAAQPAYTGSLGAASTEGQDTCDPTLGHDRTRAAAKESGQESRYSAAREKAEKTIRCRPVPVENEICTQEPVTMPQLDAQALIQGVVMSEILKRPNERKWGWR